MRRSYAALLVASVVFLLGPAVAQALPLDANSYYGFDLTGADTTSTLGAGYTIAGFIQTAAANANSIIAGNYASNDNGSVCKGTISGTVTPATHTIALVLSTTQAGCFPTIDLTLDFGVGYNSNLITVLGIITIGIPHANFIYASSTVPTNLSVSGVVQFNGEVGSVRPSLSKVARRRAAHAAAARAE